MSGEIESELDRIVDDLQRSQELSIPLIGFLEATVDNPNVSRVLDGSFCGHALDTAIRGVITSVVLFVSRSLDEHSDTHSLVNFCKKIRGKVDLIACRRRSASPQWEDKHLKIEDISKDVENLTWKIDSFSKDPRWTAIKLHRHEVLAHSLKGSSRYREKLQKHGCEIPTINYRELLAISKEVSELISRANLIWNFSFKSSEDFIKIDRDYANSFWAVLPKLSDLETSQDA